MKRTMLAVLVIALVGGLAFAQTEADFEVTLTEDGQGVVITKYTGKATQVVIPTQIQGMPVQVIGVGAFEINTRITSVVIPDGVTAIAGRAFRGQGLTSVTIPPSVTRIGPDAFEYCRNLTTVTMTNSNPSSVTEIYPAVFQNCGNLTTVTMTNRNVVFRKKDGNRFEAEISAGHMFSDCKKLTTINLPVGLVNLPDKMFSGCTSLTAIRLPEGLKEIGGGAFSNSGLTTVTLPESLEVIGNRAFRNCKLVTISLPAGIKKIGTDAFSRNASLTEVHVPDSVTAIPGSAFADCPKLNLASQAALRRVQVRG